MGRRGKSDDDALTDDALTDDALSFRHLDPVRERVVCTNNRRLGSQHLLTWRLCVFPSFRPTRVLHHMLAPNRRIQHLIRRAKKSSLCFLNRIRNNPATNHGIRPWYHQRPNRLPECNSLRTRYHTPVTEPRTLSAKVDHLLTLTETSSATQPTNHAAETMRKFL